MQGLQSRQQGGSRRGDVSQEFACLWRAGQTSLACDEDHLMVGGQVCEQGCAHLTSFRAGRPPWFPSVRGLGITGLCAVCGAAGAQAQAVERSQR